jgi:hypothetical protein
MASVTGTGSKGQSKGKAADPTALPGITKEVLREQLRQNRAIFRTQQPIRRVLSQQTLEALRTGGVGARLPIAQRAVEQARIGNAESLRSAQANIARSGLAGTPFAQRMLAQLTQQGRFQESQIPTAFAQQLIGAAGGGSQQLPSFGSLPSGAGGGGAGGKDASGVGTLLSNALVNKWPKVFGPSSS